MFKRFKKSILLRKKRHAVRSADADTKTGEAKEHKVEEPLRSFNVSFNNVCGDDTSEPLREGKIGARSREETTPRDGDLERNEKVRTKSILERSVESAECISALNRERSNAEPFPAPFEKKNSESATVHDPRRQFTTHRSAFFAINCSPSRVVQKSSFSSKSNAAVNKNSKMALVGEPVLAPSEHLSTLSTTSSVIENPLTESNPRPRPVLHISIRRLRDDMNARNHKRSSTFSGNSLSTEPQSTSKDAFLRIALSSSAEFRAEHLPPPTSQFDEKASVKKGRFRVYSEDRSGSEPRERFRSFSESSAQDQSSSRYFHGESSDMILDLPSPERIAAAADRSTTTGGVLLESEGTRETISTREPPIRTDILEPINETCDEPERVVVYDDVCNSVSDLHSTESPVVNSPGAPRDNTAAASVRFRDSYLPRSRLDAALRQDEPLDQTARGEANSFVTSAKKTNNKPDARRPEFRLDVGLNSDGVCPDLHLYEWYHGFCSKVEATLRLSNRPGGSFLVRRSSNRELHMFVISYRVSESDTLRAGRIVHVLLRHDSSRGGWIGDGMWRGFSSIKEIIDAYSHRDGYFYPVKRPEIERAERSTGAAEYMNFVGLKITDSPPRPRSNSCSTENLIKSSAEQQLPETKSPNSLNDSPTRRFAEDTRVSTPRFIDGFTRSEARDFSKNNVVRELRNVHGKDVGLPPPQPPSPTPRIHRFTSKETSYCAFEAPSQLALKTEAGFQRIYAGSDPIFLRPSPFQKRRARANTAVSTSATAAGASASTNIALGRSGNTEMSPYSAMPSAPTVSEANVSQ